ncbi:hypothetical protein [Kitasatospora nipponensis]|uniref:hypothetical protein n=1 Tax=Kitasatospora nipponensis TaxID=258049 RepID=UPI0031DAE965
MTKLRWNDPEKWIKSTGIAHEPLITTGDFYQVQLKLKARATSQATERKPRATEGPYVCMRKMQGNFNNGHPHYRCRYSSEYAQSHALDRPLTVHLREDVLLPVLDSWIGTVFAPGRLKRTIHEMQEAQAVSGPDPAVLEAARRDLDTSAARLTSYRAALDAGGDPATVAGWINEARLDQATAQQRLNQLTAEAPPTLTGDQVQAVIAKLGNLTDRLMQAKPERKAPLYEAFGLKLVYDAKKRVVTVES